MKRSPPPFDIVVFAAACLATFGCSGDQEDEPPMSHTLGGAGGETGGDPAAGSGSEPEAGAEAEPAGKGFLAARDDGWLSLIEGSWEIPGDSEGYRCARLTVPEDVYIAEFTPLIPLGTHHTVLTVADRPEGPDGVTECSVATNAPRQIYGSGVGTEGSKLPDGVAVHLRKGQQLLLNMHLFNAGDTPLTGTSGTLVRTMNADEVVTAADTLLAGPTNLTIPPGRVVQSGKCTLEDDSTIFAVGPHMHQLGVHMKVVAHSGEAGDVVLFDGPYDFNEQLHYGVPMVPMQAGDVIDIECTYENDRNETVHFGDSSLQEMCFAGIFRFPEAPRGSFLCTN